MTSDLIVKRDNGAVIVEINRVDRHNALSKQVNLDLKELALMLGNDASVHVVVIKGAGERAFSAGADLKERKSISASKTGAYVDAISGAVNAWAQMPKPTIAAVGGFAFGGGFELALACDFRIASDNAAFALTEVRLGIMPGAGGTQRLPRLIGMARAKELVLLGRRISAAEALTMGLVSDVVPREKLMNSVETMIEDLTACAPLSVAKAKEAMDLGIEVPIEQGLEIERRCYETTLHSEDRNEGLRAFAEKRPPKYQGR